VRVALDTNVLLAGTATHGICEGLLALCFRDHVVLLSDHVLGEFAEHYVGKFKATDQQAALVVETFRKHGEMVVPTEVAQEAFADGDDLPVLGTAVAGRADYLVTGDKQLLELGIHQGIPILSTRDFYDRIRETE
jgi:putative PIN family toxin of toxin-antitoxin system